MKVRTLEERVKFDHGLTIGRHLVKFTFGERSRLALVDISKRGIVRYFAKPVPEDMYSSWQRMKGEKSIIDGPILVWAGKDPDVLKLFDGEPAATIPARVTEGAT